VRILLPSSNFRAQVWSNQIGSFVEIESDVIEQKHWQKNGQQFVDYEMFLKTFIEPDEVLLVKVVRNLTDDRAAEEKEEPKEAVERVHNLQIQGVSEKGEVLFQYSNKEQNLTQTFGVNLKKYIAHQVLDMDHVFRDADMYQGTEVKLQLERSEGGLLFMPDYKTPLPQQFSEVNQDVIYQKGNMLEQWTIIYDKSNEERAMLKVLFSEHFKGLIEFDVELNTIPISDDQGKDITVNWKMFNGFNPKGQFWTDSNALEMQPRQITNYSQILQDYTQFLPKDQPTYKNMSRNFYPVDSAIAMRDFQDNSSIQVTILNDRPQGGSADLSSPSTIELMQHRRVLMTDEYGASTGVNETDRDGKGVRVRAKYFMQIFDTKKGRSLQREQQLNIQQPPLYFFAFDYKRTPKPKVSNKKDQQLSTTFAKELGAGLHANSTYRLFPLGRNEVLVRFENLADAFDIVNE